MSTEKEPDVVDLTKENKDTPGKSKKLKQPRIAFAKINKQEYLETVKTTIVDESKKRKISSDVDSQFSLLISEVDSFLLDFEVFLGGRFGSPLAVVIVDAGDIVVAVDDIRTF